MNLFLKSSNFFIHFLDFFSHFIGRFELLFGRSAKMAAAAETKIVATFTPSTKTHFKLKNLKIFVEKILTLGPENYFFNGDLYIILNLRSLEIGEQSIF